ncbi:MAG: SH3 domain-containing protein [Spirochaetaceae bacterium]|nr:SH3 domain-containing protein [Spirochaetaceae bacterium]
MISRRIAAFWILLFFVMSCGRNPDSEESNGAPEKLSVSKSVEATVTGDRLRVRRLPYLDQDVVGYLMAGDEVAVESRTVWTEIIGGTEAPWFYVSFNGLSGWTYGGFLEFSAGDVGAVIADTAMAPPKSKTTEFTSSDNLDSEGLPELLLPVFGMETGIEVFRPREGTITYDSRSEYLIVPYGFVSDSSLVELSSTTDPSGFRVAAESPGGSHFERSFAFADLKKLSETASSLPPGFPSGADALLIPFFHLATLEEGSWEFYAFIGDENWPAAVGKTNIKPSEASVVKTPTPDPFRDSPRSSFVRGDIAYVFGRFSQSTPNLQVALYHDTEDFQNGKIRLKPVAAKRCITEDNGRWFTTINIDNRIPEGRCWIAVGDPIESVDNLLLFTTYIQL